MPAATNNRSEGVGSVSDETPPMPKSDSAREKTRANYAVRAKERAGMNGYDHTISECLHLDDKLERIIQNNPDMRAVLVGYGQPRKEKMTRGGESWLQHKRFSQGYGSHHLGVPTLG
ncbi:putative protein phosphatase 2C 40 [Dorcoceras hygrometricum]|uniref:Uncharacterized protein n=1 Tax=Dorcoceras hygrometricum TaxID=472368 RepID=A0A2Z7AQA5_9LAMI|nr:putative protein phosphatase 2C 40 [Dorcoceras hygrometricum]